MKKKVIYICSLCDKEFDSHDECFAHELKEIGITNSIFLRWKELNKKVKHLSHVQSHSHNEKTVDAFERAVDQLVAFEKKHNIDEATIKAL